MLEKMKTYGVEPKHLTKLIPVSRVTASNWLNGHVDPSRHLIPYVRLVDAALQSAIDDAVVLDSDNMVGVLQPRMKLLKDTITEEI